MNNEQVRAALQSLYEMTSRYAISDTDYGIVCHAAAALATSAAHDADELHFNAQRLRNVVELVGLRKAVPESDAVLDDARGSVLGMIADELRERAAAPERSGKLADDSAPELRDCNWCDNCYSGNGKPCTAPVQNPATEADNIAQCPDCNSNYPMHDLDCPRVPAKADSSSAAPSVLSAKLRTVHVAYNGHGEELKGICDQAADELDRLAAPAPSAAPSDGYQHGSHSAEHIAAILGRPDLIASVAALKHKLWCAEVNLDGAKEEIAELRLTTPSPTGESLSIATVLQDIVNDGYLSETQAHRARSALATPRQTEDDLKAALIELASVQHQLIDANATITAYQLAESAARQTEDGGLSVRLCEMHESNGNVTWDVRIAKSQDASLLDTFSVYIDTIKGRAEYEADSLKHFLGLGPLPYILAYDTDAPKEPAAQGGVQEAQAMRAALTTIAAWKLPATGETWDDGTPMSFGGAFGSNGERDYMRSVALNALGPIEVVFESAAPTGASHGE